MIHALVPTVDSIIDGEQDRVESITEIDELFDEDAVNYMQKKASLPNFISRVISAIKETTEGVLHFETPEAMDSENLFLS